MLCCVVCVVVVVVCVVVVVVLLVFCVCVCCGTVKKREKTVFGFKNVSVCGFKTSPCVPAPRAHVLPHAGVVPVHTGTF